MSVLKFDGYKVTHMSYERNEDYTFKNKPLLLNPTPTTSIDVSDDKIDVTLNIVAGSLEDKKIPFKVACSLVGEFTYDPEEDKSSVGLDTLVRNNAVAILYPYARAVIATLTNTSGEFPSYNMPTVNISKWLADQKQD